MFWPQVVDKRRTFRPWLIAKPEGCGILVVDGDEALHSCGHGRQFSCGLGMPGEHLLAVIDEEVTLPDRALKPAPGRLVDLAGFQKGHTLFLGFLHNRSRQWMLGVLLQTGDQDQDLLFREAGGGDDLDKFRLAVSQRSGLIEDGRAAGVDLFEHGRIFNDDASAGRE